MVLKIYRFHHADVRMSWLPDQRLRRSLKTRDEMNRCFSQLGSNYWFISSYWDLGIIYKLKYIWYMIRVQHSTGCRKWVLLDLLQKAEALVSKHHRRDSTPTAHQRTSSSFPCSFPLTTDRLRTLEHFLSSRVPFPTCVAGNWKQKHEYEMDDDGMNV